MENLSEVKVVSEFESPIYSVMRIPVSNLCGQSSNPNSMSSKSFAALQRSIFNAGYGMSIVAAINPIYDEEFSKQLTDLQKINLCIQGSENDAKSGLGSDTQFATQLSDDSLRRAYRYQIVDGSQRSSVIRLGSKYFMEDPKSTEKAEKWVKGEDIPDEPGKEMLKYLAWRENFCVPAAILKGKTDQEMMSSTVLFNTARGAHSLDSMKEIVANLVNVAGMSEEWISKNLYIDIESVKRMTQLSGLKTAFNSTDSADLSWNPYEDASYERKETSFLNREAAKYVQKYLKDNPDIEERGEMGDIIAYAKSLGWNEETTRKLFNQ